MPKVAIIVPTLNEERFIAQCLDSVISQSMPIAEMDIMVVDGGSTDKTIEIVMQYHSLYPNIRLLRNPQKIQSIAFNIGVKNSVAPFIVRLDAHAVYNTDYVAICVKQLESNPCIGNVGGVWNILPQNCSLSARTNAVVNKVKFGIGGAAFRMGTKSGEVDTVPFGAFPRKVIEEIGGMREDLPRGEDNEYNSRIRKAGYKVFLDSRIVSTYFARPTLATSCKQMYNNGFSIGNLFHIDRDAIGIRHMIPLCFVFSLVCSLLLAIFIHALWFIPVILIFVYFMAAFCASFIACKEHDFDYFLLLPIYFFCIHCSYGLGTFVGLFCKYK